MLLAFCVLLVLQAFDEQLAARVLQGHLHLPIGGEALAGFFCQGRILRGGPMSSVILDSTLTCPNCGHTKSERMPTDACQWFYECESCRAILRPKPGDCCVFCSYGTVPCPPIQERGKQHGCCG